MAFEKVKELNAETTVSLRSKGDRLEGYYHGSKEVPTKYGTSLLHIFEISSGENVGVWGSGRLNFGLKSLAPKNGKSIMLRITCDGTVPSSKGNEAYAYTIEKDKSKTTDAAVAVDYEEGNNEDNEASSFSAADEDEDNSMEAEEASYEQPKAVVTVPRRTNTNVSASNRDKVNSLLGVSSKRPSR